MAEALRRREPSRAGARRGPQPGGAAHARRAPGSCARVALTIKSLDGYGRHDDRDHRHRPAGARPHGRLSCSPGRRRSSPCSASDRPRRRRPGACSTRRTPAFVEAGLYRTLQPRRFGGYELGLRDFVRVMSEISRGCPSSGWVLALTAGPPAPAEPLERGGAGGALRRDRRRARSRPAGPGRAGGPHGRRLHRQSGAWDYASGCDHSTHFMGSAIVPGDAEPPRLMWLLIDRADYEIVDNWDVIGLRGTGSKRVVCGGRCTCPSTGASRRSARPASVRRAGAATRTRCTPAACSASSSSSSAPSRSAPRAGRSTSTRTSCGAKALDIPPFVLRGEVDEYQHHLGRAVGLVDVAEAALLEGADRYMDQATRAVRGRPAGRRQRRGDAAAALPRSSTASACATRRSTWSSGRAARAARAAGTRSATRCWRSPSCAPTWACSWTARRRTSGACGSACSRASYEHARRARRRRRRAAPAPARRAGRDARSARATRRSCTRRSASSASTGSCSRAATAAWRWTCPPSTG